MLDTIFTSSNPTTSQIMISLFTSLAIGFLIALCYMFKTKHTKSFTITLSIIPACVSTIILLVNGNIGSGVAVAGAFSLIRFRSAPGSAKEIGAIFIAMAAGLACGMGYLFFALCFSIVLGLAMVIYTSAGLGQANKEKTLRIAIAEDLDYSNVFTPILAQYTSQSTLMKVKTANLGSIYKLTYSISLKDPSKEKEFMDALRCRNGNLEISICQEDYKSDEL